MMTMPAGPGVLPMGMRQAMMIADLCPDCGKSFGIPANWNRLLGRVTAHINETASHTRPTMFTPREMRRKNAVQSRSQGR